MFNSWMNGNTIACFALYSLSKERSSYVAVVIRLDMMICIGDCLLCWWFWEIWCECSHHIYHNSELSPATLTRLAIDEANVRRMLTHGTSFCQINLAYRARSFWLTLYVLSYICKLCTNCSYEMEMEQKEFGLDKWDYKSYVWLSLMTTYK